jgi:hypothetical protein
MNSLHGSIDHGGDIRWQMLLWRGANRRCHHLRIGHGTGHLLDGHFHESLHRGPHLLGVRLLGATSWARTSVTLAMVNVTIFLATISVMSSTVPSIMTHGMAALMTSTNNVVRVTMTNFAACVTGSGESIVGNHGALRAFQVIIVEALQF